MVIERMLALLGLCNKVMAFGGIGNQKGVQLGFKARRFAIAKNKGMNAHDGLCFLWLWLNSLSYSTAHSGFPMPVSTYKWAATLLAKASG